MSFFGKIPEKLDIRPAKAAPMPPLAPMTATRAAPAEAAAIPVVDVVAKLEQLAAANPQKRNWKTSIVDLLKLLDIDSSFDAREALATELGIPVALLADSAKMNKWLHKTMLQKMADNGANIPKDMLD